MTLVGRRWLISLIAIAATTIVVVVGLRIYMTRFVAYPIAERFLHDSTIVRTQLGEIVSARLTFINAGEFGMIGTTVVAEYNFSVRGTVSNGTVSLSLERQAGSWRLTKGTVLREDALPVQIEPQVLSELSDAQGG
jgi:hypothetical protein